MLEFTEFPYLPPGNPHKAVLAFIHWCRELPTQGEQFRQFRNRMKQYRLWEQDRVQGTFDFLGMQRTGTVTASALVKNIKAQKTDDKAREMLSQRLWEVNPLLFKVIIELLKERVYSRDEVIKHIDSFAYRGKKPNRVALEAWLHMALGLDILKLVGIALDLGPKAQGFLEQAAGLDAEEFLQDAEAAGAEAGSQAPMSPGADLDADGDDEGSDATNQAAEAQAAPAPAMPAGARALVSPAATDPAAGLIDASKLSSPRGRNPQAAVSRFAGHAIFASDVLDETTQRIQAWWTEQTPARAGANAADFGLDTHTWMEGAEETVYRVAVAAALTFRLGRDRETVKKVFESLDRAGVLRDLYYGTAPDTLPENVDSKALMLASLVARRCAELPELASTLEKQESAAAAFQILDSALGRGLFKIELFWMMGALEDLGALRFDDLASFAALPRRLVRDTLYRLGFIESPYAHDAVSLIPAARAAHRAAGSAQPADEVLMGFCLAAGCSYDCANRRDCEYACRERAE